jgi:hypothetical protein
MANRHIITDSHGMIRIHMDHGIVLDIASVANHNGGSVTANGGMIPNANLFTQGHIPEYDRSGSDKNSVFFCNILYFCQIGSPHFSFCLCIPYLVYTMFPAVSIPNYIPFFSSAKVIKL